MSGCIFWNKKSNLFVTYKMMGRLNGKHEEFATVLKRLTCQMDYCSAIVKTKQVSTRLDDYAQSLSFVRFCLRFRNVACIFVKWSGVFCF